MTWVPLHPSPNTLVLLPMEGERVSAKLESGKVLELIYDGGDWIDPRYPNIRVTFCNVTHWTPIGGY